MEAIMYFTITIFVFYLLCCDWCCQNEHASNPLLIAVKKYSEWQPILWCIFLYLILKRSMVWILFWLKQVLLAKGADVNARAGTRNTALMYAANNQKLDLVQVSFTTLSSLAKTSSSTTTHFRLWILEFHPWKWAMKPMPHLQGILLVSFQNICSHYSVRKVRTLL